MPGKKATPYSSIRIENFRCFRELQVPRLSKVNLVAGRNNVGKTAFLEAVFLHAGGYDPGLVIKLDDLRGYKTVRVELGTRRDTPWDGFFYGFDAAVPVRISAGIGKTRRVVELRVLTDRSELARIGESAKQPEATALDALVTSAGAKVLGLNFTEGRRKGSYYMILDTAGIRTTPITPAPALEAYFVSGRGGQPQEEIAQRYGKLQESGEEQVVSSALRIIEPRLKGLKMVVGLSGPALQGDIGLDRTVPLPLMGEGMVRLASLIVYIGAAKGGLVLIDELEWGLHYSVLESVWQVVAEASARFGTQVFATTHSRECIIAAQRVFSGRRASQFLLHRLDRSDDETRVVTYDVKTLAAALEAGFEVR